MMATRPELFTGGHHSTACPAQQTSAVHHQGTKLTKEDWKGFGVPIDKGWSAMHNQLVDTYLLSI